MSKPDGGPATPPDSIYSEANPGLTIRDFFAAAALTGMAIAARELPDDSRFRVIAHDIAACAYEYADAMLKERKTE